MMNQLHAMRIFLAVADIGSIGRAAASLHLSTAVVSRYVSLLESHLGARLVNRNTRSMSLTEAGRTYAEGCRQILTQCEEIEACVGQSVTEPKGTLKIAAAASFSAIGLTPLLQRYRLQHPAVKLAVTLLHSPVDLVEEGFDVGIVSPRQVSAGTLINRPLLEIKPMVVASKGYVATHGTPCRPADLASHTFLAPSLDLHGPDWCFTGPNRTEQTVTLNAAYTINSTFMLRQSVIADMGVAVLPETYVAGDLLSGTLVALLTEYRVKDARKNLSLVYPGRRHVSAKVRSFVDFTINHFRHSAGGDRDFLPSMTESKITPEFC
jgi:DNA-binding transcriptional LysR family regulator